MSLKAKIEAVIYAADEPVTPTQLAEIFGEEALEAQTSATLPLSGDTFDEAAMEAATDAAEEPDSAIEDANAKKLARARDRAARVAIQKIVDELIAEYTTGERGMEIRQIAGGYRVATKPEYHDAVRLFVKAQKPQLKLSLQALETLAVVAYKQPVTGPEISEIRGVDTSGVLGGLMARKLITTAGRKQVIGRPILYKTTREFLLRFGLKDVSELPSMEEFEKMAADMASEMGEADDAMSGSSDAGSSNQPEADVAAPGASSELPQTEPAV